MENQQENLGISTYLPLLEYIISMLPVSFFVSDFLRS